jgi:hypothetical protein
MYVVIISDNGEVLEKMYIDEALNSSLSLDSSEIMSYFVELLEDDDYKLNVTAASASIASTGLAAVATPEIVVNTKIDTQVDDKTRKIKEEW